MALPGSTCLAQVLDIYSRKVVGWSMDKHMEEQLVTSALQMAASQRRPGEGVLHHSDRGSRVPFWVMQRTITNNCSTLTKWWSA